MARERILVAMSGGVDSSMAARLLIEQGYNCVGGTMRLFGDDASPVTSTSAEARCGNARDIEDARAVAAQLGIPFTVFDCREAFDRDVVEAFVQAYERGVTPNPCTLCNRRIKFGLLLECARNIGCETVATGHYARVRTRQDSAGNPVYELAKAADPAKDQSYFLYGLTQNVLAHVRFPLGDLMKERDVRAAAQAAGLPVAHKHESQGICFVPKNDFATFIENRRGTALPEGDIVGTDGTLLGHHHGAIRYTVGQRKGLGVAASKPLYVTAIDALTNTVVLGDEEDLFASTLIAEDWVWSAPAAELACALAHATETQEGMRAQAQIRYHQPNQDVRLFLEEGDARQTLAVRVCFDQPQRAIAPGQAVVIYQDDVVLGGGTITRAF